MESTYYKKVFADELEIKIENRTFRMKGTFKAMREIEGRACCGISAIAQRIISNIAGINDITAIVYGGIIGKIPEGLEPPISYEDLGELILKNGMAKILEPCTDFITFGMTGKMPGEETKEELKKKVLRQG